MLRFPHLHAFSTPFGGRRIQTLRAFRQAWFSELATCLRLQFQNYQDHLHRDFLQDHQDHSQGVSSRTTRTTRTYSRTASRAPSNVLGGKMKNIHEKLGKH